LLLTNDGKGDEQPVTAPRVFGYVRVGSHRERVERWRVRIAAFCRVEGLALELVFADSAVSDTELVRPGWTALLDVLGSKGAQVVVVPAEDHLSRDPVLRADMRAQLAAVGVTVVVMPARMRLTAARPDEE
jgi:DNA invertase Pin-like site-specific DNA recombinase